MSRIATLFGSSTERIDHRQAHFAFTFSQIKTMAFKDKYPVLVLEVTLLDMPSPIWREVAVRSGTSMRELHHIIQAIIPA
jgi:hypothetical protein